jgi:hypothetical protein
LTNLTGRRSVGAVMTEPALRVVIALDYLLSTTGRFSLMPVLAIMLARRSGNAGWITAGVGLFSFTVCAGLSSLPITRWLPRLPYAVSMPASMACAAVGFGLLAYASNPVATVALLFVAGFGNSVHTVLIRVLINEAVDKETHRNIVYSIQQIATNVAATLGPFVAGALYVAGDARSLLAFVAVAYLLAGLCLAVGIPRGLHPPGIVRDRTGRVATGLRLLRDRHSRHVTVITTLGSFAYGQFYSAFALLVALAVSPALLRSALLAGPPAAIALLQVPVTAGANRLLRGRTRPLAILTVAVLTFGAAIGILGTGLPVVAGAIAAMTVWSVAEMLFSPMVSVTFSQITSVSRMAASNLQGVAWTTGEAFGSLCGGSLFLVCYQHGAGHLYWLLLAGITVAGAVPHHLTKGTAP